MIRKKTEHETKVIDLTGPDGNAFCLLGYAKIYAHQRELNWEEIRTNMTSGNYEHLLEVFDRYFGSFVILER